MSLINSTAIPSGASAYEIEQSLRFNDNDSGNLSRTPTSASNRRTWTFSAWVKSSSMSTADSGNSSSIFEAFENNDNRVQLYFDDGNNPLSLYCKIGGTKTMRLLTNAVYRDFSAWYHIVLAVDTTQGTDTNRVKLYVNGEQITSFSSSIYPSQNVEHAVNNTNVHHVGARSAGSSIYAGTHFDGYMAEVNFIDGLAKVPTDFGEYGTYGEWKPIEYSGSYGTNGFYLPFKQDYTVEGFSTVLYKGTGVDETYIGGVGFQSDLTFVARRNNAENHIWIDSVRGTNKRLLTNVADGEATDDNIITGFTTDGFTIGTDAGTNAVDNYVAWNWDMGGSNATNTQGSIQSTVRANPTYGQSIVSWTSNGSNGLAVGHGLSSAPQIIIYKTRANTNEWYTWLNAVVDSSQDYVRLNATAAKVDINSSTYGVPSSTLISNFGFTNNHTMIAYCFHSVTGYSKIGSYTGNGSTTGPSVTLGFAPAFLLIKSAGQAEPWSLIDNMRTHSTAGLLNVLTTNSTAVETQYAVDLNSNGFQIKTSSGVLNSGDGGGQTYIYMAFADKREYAYWLDQSGNNNDWTSNNLTESDVMVDSPTNNFATLNPLDKVGAPTFSEGNLKVSVGDDIEGRSSIYVDSGKWYCEYLVSSIGNNGTLLGISVNEAGINSLASNNGVAYFSANGNKYVQASGASYGASYAAGDIIGVALDQDNHTVNFYKNNSAQGAITIPTDSHTFSIANSGTASVVVANFGQDSSFAGAKTAGGNADGNGIGDFFYAPPSGFLTLCTKNLPDATVTPSKHFNTVLYTANAGTNVITGVGFQPDFSWFKIRNSSGSPALFDVIRGVNSGLASNQAAAEYIAASDKDLVSFDSDGFTLGAGEDWASVNQTNGSSIVAWNWKAGTSASGATNGAGGSNKTYTASYNADAGFSIVNYVGNAAGGHTIPHHLGAIAEMIIVKNRNASEDWRVYHHLLGQSVANDAHKWLALNSTAAATDSYDSWWDVEPTSSVFSVGNGDATNKDGSNHIAYCFRSIDGYSKVGTYVGNGNADGVFVHTGFAVQWVMIKRTDSANYWLVLDDTRREYNPNFTSLYPNLSNAEDNFGNGTGIDFLSNGFKHRDNVASTNASGGTYIYIAFASVPSKFANAR